MKIKSTNNRNRSLRNNFLFIILLVLLTTCQKVEKIDTKPNLLLQEVKTFFQNSQDNTISNNAFQAKEHRLSIKKNPQWSQAFLKNLSNTEVLVVPLSFEEKLFTQPAINEKAPLENWTYLIYYKDADQQLHQEMVTQMPDANFWPHRHEPGYPFTGLILVETLDGSWIYGFQFEAGGIHMITPSAYQPSKLNNNQKAKGNPKNAVYCILVDYYTAVTVGGSTETNYDYSRRCRPEIADNGWSKYSFRKCSLKQRSVLLRHWN